MAAQRRSGNGDITQALAKGHVFCVDLSGRQGDRHPPRPGRVTGVDTDQGPINAEFVVNAGGMWARDIGAMAGVAVPLHVRAFLCCD